VTKARSVPRRFDNFSQTPENLFRKSGSDIRSASEAGRHPYAQRHSASPSITSLAGAGAPAAGAQTSNVTLKVATFSGHSGEVEKSYIGDRACSLMRLASSAGRSRRRKAPAMPRYKACSRPIRNWPGPCRRRKPDLAKLYSLNQSVYNANLARATDYWNRNVRY